MKKTEYTFTDKEADVVKQLVVCDNEIRRNLLIQHLGEFGLDATLDLFTNFIGMANSVVKNCHDIANEEATIRGVIHPDSSANLNLATLFGAAHGIKLANSNPSDKMCNGCAFRLGTAANQSEVTVFDAEYTKVESANKFMCHESYGNRKKCIGHTTSNLTKQ